MSTSPDSIAEDFAKAWNEGAAGALADLFAEDADFVNVVGLWWNTRDQIREAHTYGFRRMFPDSVMTLSKVTSRRLGNDVAVVHAAWTMRGQVTPEGKPSGERAGVLSFVLARQNDQTWSAVSAQNTDKSPGMQTHVAEDGSLTATNYSQKRRI